jgi:PAS domain S-box-containing protein
MGIIDNLVDGIVFTDPEGKVILINPAAGRMLGIPSFTALGRTLAEVDGTKTLLSLLAAHRAVELPEEGIRADESLTSGGAEAHYSVQTNEIHDVNRKLSGALSLLRDVSLRKKTEHLQNQFLSIVAHELRTPLTAIKAFATILQKGIHGELPEEQLSMVQSILSQTDRLGHEIDKIINLGRLDASDFSPDTSGVEVRVILKKLATPFQVQANEKQISLVAEEGPEDLKVLADQRDIRRALQALVENALKFTPEGGSVEIRTVTEPDAVVFQVRDTGIGVAPEDHEFIFEKFTQLENPLTRQYGGSGLGLSFASGIVRAHGSAIEVESELGEGATFSFRLRRIGEDLREALVAAATVTEQEREEECEA